MEVATRPEWMDDEFLSTCIINYNKLPNDSSIDISDVKLFYAVPKGENYLSIIFRVNIDYHVVDGAKSNSDRKSKQYTASLIVKACHETETMKELTKEMKVFRKEIDMYRNIMPTITRILDNANITANIACSLLHSAEGERDVLVLEDLKLKRYVLADRMKGLDLVHSKLVLDKLAKLHAASMIHFSTNEVPELYLSSPFESFKVINEDEMGKLFIDSTRQRIKNAITEMESDPKYGKNIIDYFKSYDKVFIDAIERDMKRVPGSKFNALLHGDCWVNNMMFKYNEDGSVNDIVFVDLQISYYSSIAIDVAYFLYTSTSKEVRKHHFKELEKFYIDSLSHYLQKINYIGDIPTLEEFDDELKRIMSVAINTIMVTNAIVLAEYQKEDVNRTKKEVFDMDEVLQLNSTSKTYMDVFLLSVDLMEENGYFDNYNLPEPDTN